MPPSEVDIEVEVEAGAGLRVGVASSYESPSSSGFDLPASLDVATTFSSNQGAVVETSGGGWSGDYEWRMMVGD